MATQIIYNIHTTLCPQRPSHKVVTWLPSHMYSGVMAAHVTAQVILLFRRELLASAFLGATFVTEDAVTVFHSGVGWKESDRRCAAR
jgi:hypothetical protein